MRTVSLLLVCLTSLGCGLPPTGAPSDWVVRQGGLSRDADAAAKAMRAVAALNTRSDVRVAVLNSLRPGASAWPEGVIYVTRGLMDMASDAELTAAIAHEIAHLDAHRAGGLATARHGLAEEMHADRAAMDLLVNARCDPAAVGSLLTMLATSDALPEGVRRDLRARARAAVNRLGSLGSPGAASPSEQVVTLGQR